MMTGKGMAACVTRMVRETGVKNVVATYVPPESEDVDGEVEVRLNGELLALSLQVGAGYYGVNKYFYGDDGLDGAEHLYMGADPYKAASLLVKEVFVYAMESIKL